MIEQCCNNIVIMAELLTMWTTMLATDIVHAGQQNVDSTSLNVLCVRTCVLRDCTEAGGFKSTLQYSKRNANF